MTGLVAPYSDAVRKHYPRGGPAGAFTAELARALDCTGAVMQCLRTVDAQRLITASLSLYEEKYKNQVRSRTHIHARPSRSRYFVEQGTLVFLSPASRC